MTEIRAVVVAVCLSTPATRVAKAPQDEAFAGPHGFAGDRHASELRQKRDGSVIPNERQWSAVSSDEISELCAGLGVPVFALGALGENLRLSGLRMADLAAGAVLEFPSGARFEVSGQNDPCVNAAAELSQTYGEAVGQYFVKQAYGRRGVVGRVLTPGPIRAGDEVTVRLQESRPA